MGADYCQRPTRKLSQLLGTGFGFVPMSSLTAGWVLSGASSQWKNAKPGKVFDTFLNGDYANPVIVVDELDKSGGDGQYDPLGALYELLEMETATRFIDEFVEVPIDASGAQQHAGRPRLCRIGLVDSGRGAGRLERREERRAQGLAVAPLSRRENLAIEGARESADAHRGFVGDLR